MNLESAFDQFSLRYINIHIIIITITTSSTSSLFILYVELIFPSSSKSKRWNLAGLSLYLNIHIHITFVFLSWTSIQNYPPICSNSLSFSVILLLKLLQLPGHLQTLLSLNFVQPFTPFYLS